MADASTPAMRSTGFALFAEAMLVGVVVVALSVPVITLPAGLAAGVNHLRRHVALDPAPAAAFRRDLRDALAGGLAVGAVALGGALAALFTVGLAGSDPTPTGTVMSVVGVLGVGIVAVAVLMAAGSWTRERGWRAAVRGLRDDLDADPGGALYLLVSVGFVALLTWLFVPLLPLAVGLAAFAVVAVEGRGGGRRGDGTGQEP